MCQYKFYRYVSLENVGLYSYWFETVPEYLWALPFPRFTLLLHLSGGAYCNITIRKSQYKFSDVCNELTEAALKRVCLKSFHKASSCSCFHIASAFHHRWRFLLSFFSVVYMCSFSFSYIFCGIFFAAIRRVARGGAVRLNDLNKHRRRPFFLLLSVLHRASKEPDLHMWACCVLCEGRFADGTGPVSAQAYILYPFGKNKNMCVQQKKGADHACHWN